MQAASERVVAHRQPPPERTPDDETFETLPRLLAAGLELLILGESLLSLVFILKS